MDNPLHTSPKIMGILNLTEDSFSDGALYLDTAKAIEHASLLIQQGAQIIDLGAESTRPGSLPASPKLEIERIIPVLQELVKLHPEVIYSIDTRKAPVAQAAIEAGALMINDISALRYDPDMPKVFAKHPEVSIVLMHMQGEPQTMQDNPQYSDVLCEITAFFSQRIAFCESQGISRDRLLLDPGIGFGKNLQHNLDIISNLNYFHSLGLPVVLGASRKSFINAISPTPVAERLEGSLAAAACASLSKVQIVRVHDVLEHKRFLTVFTSLLNASRS